MGLGKAVLEINATVDQDVLDKYDLKLDSSEIVAKDKEIPLLEELIKDHKSQLVAGGSTQTSIRVAQWMLRKKGQTAFLGCTGDDDNGNLLKECADDANVLTFHLKTDKEPTSTCAYLVKDNERVVVKNPGASEVYNPEEMTTESLCEIVRQARYYYMNGDMVDVSLEAVVTLGRHALEQEKIVVTNFSAPWLVKKRNSELASAFGYSKYILGHEDEMEELRKRLNFGDNLREAVQKLSDLPGRWGGKRTIVITRGNKSTLVGIEGGDVLEVEVEPLSEDEIIDMNGAGDAFAGGFLSQLVRERPILDCVKAGHWAARAMIKTSGTKLPEKCSFRPAFGPLLPP